MHSFPRRSNSVLHLPCRWWSWWSWLQLRRRGAVDLTGDVTLYAGFGRGRALGALVSVSRGTSMSSSPTPGSSKSVRPLSELAIRADLRVGLRRRSSLAFSTPLSSPSLVIAPVSLPPLALRPFARPPANNLKADVQPLAIPGTFAEFILT
jgi:hypothetical protein